MVPDALETFVDRPNVVVTRTFSKAYALAGLRVGYCVGAPDVVTAARKTQVPFSVSGLAQECAIAALGEARRGRAPRRADRRRARSGQQGAGQPRVRRTAVAGEFRLARGWGSGRLRSVRTVRPGGVIVRPFAGEGVRVTIGLPEENDAFLELCRIGGLAH